ncbi:neuroligin-4, X-linked-like [Liolophura sinensis]|uniref:neuroligin-4, X-linked-like n=1 Tax=Liolophura sinensis TaxID=3198878 RepID=UPI0031597934
MGILPLISLVVVSIATASASVVNTTVGEVRGQENTNVGIETFLGIPYAEAPEGDLRFKPPVRKSRMDGVFNAVSNEFICPQQTDFTSLTLNLNMTEDCLRLDIYRPLQSSKANQLPVMVWIHGGAYIIGDSQTYNGNSLAGMYGVVVVVINYRLGVLGFLDTLDEHSIGNFGLRDQCSALEWVSDNIEEFGGNFSSVTIFGESAGSASVIQLAISSLCHGKFSKIIAQSGSAWAPWSHNRNPLKIAKDLAVKTGCPTETGAMVTCLREKPFQDLIAAQALQLAEPSLGLFNPSYRRDVFPENPMDMVKNPESSEPIRRFRSLDLMIGIMKEEGESSINFELTGKFDGVIANLSSGIMSDNSQEERISTTLRRLLTQDEDVIRKLLPTMKYQYTDWKNRENPFANTRMAARFEGDINFVVSIVQAARLHAGPVTPSQEDRRSENTFFYQFLHKSSFLPVYPWTDGGTHFEDVPYVFGYTTQVYNGTADEEALSRAVMEYWTNFAKSGNPNLPSKKYIQTTWPTFDAEMEKFVQLEVNMSPNSTSTFPYARRVAFWEELVPAQIKSIEDFKKELKESEEKEKEKCKPPNTANALAGGILCVYLLPLVLYSVIFGFYTQVLF